MSLPLEFGVTLRFLSDWHVGTGHGRLGTVDAVVRRDAVELPFVPAKSLVGVWRDACETVAETLDGESVGWRAWVTWLFGSHNHWASDPGREATPVPAALRLTPAQAPDWLRVAVGGKPALAQAAVVLRPGVQMDYATGTAIAGRLRVEERAIRELELSSQVSIAMPDETGQLPEAAELLLRAGARLVEAIGGKRNRGSGRVAIVLPGVEVDTSGVHPRVIDARLNQLLASRVPGTPPPPPATRHTVDIHPYGRLHPDQRRTVRVALRVLTPVVVASEVLGNVIFSREAIPGTALLGTMLGRIDIDGSRLGLGDISVGDAVPAAPDPADPTSVVPSQPVPAVWQRADKGRGDSVYNVLLSNQGREHRAKPMTGWITPDGDGWQYHSQDNAVSAHATIDDAARRPTTAVGGVHTYLGIPPNTVLCTDIVLPARARLRLDAGERLRFGRSRKDDFGLVEVVKVIDPVRPPVPPVLDGDRLRVWCVSDVLLRDDRLAPDPSPVALARALTGLLAPATVCVVPDKSVGGATRRDGFGVAWGRPRPSQVALQAGSVVTLEVNGSVEPARLAELERDGVGERTAEGYGRIRFNPPELAAEKPRVAFSRDAEPAPAGPEQAGIGLDEPPHPLEINAWRHAIRRASAGLTPEHLVTGIDKLRNKRAQLGSLRVQLERLTLPDGPRLVEDWLKAIRAVRARREEWGDGVLDVLKALLVDDPNLVWCRLRLGGEQSNLVLSPGREDAVRRRLHTEALVVSMTAVLRRLTAANAGLADSSSTTEAHQ